MGQGLTEFPSAVGSGEGKGGASKRALLILGLSWRGSLPARVSHPWSVMSYVWHDTSPF